MTRLRSLPQTTASGYRRTYNSAGALTTEQLISWVASSKTTQDEIIPNFHVRSKRGEIFNNPFSSTTVTRHREGSYESRDPSNARWYYDRGSIWQYIGLPEPTVSIDTAALVAKAKTDAAANMNKTDFNLPVFASEWSKTRMLHRDVGNALVALFSQRRAGKLARNLSSAWLVGRYGVMPTLNDLSSAVKFLDRKYSSRYTARGAASGQGISSSTYTVADTPCNWYNSVQVTRVFTVRAGVLYESSPLIRDAAQLGLTRPLSVVWERLPYSFVLDWFVDVGTWLDAIQPSGGRQLCGWETTRDYVHYAYARSGNSPIQSGYTSSWSGSAYTIYETKSRVPWSGSVPTAPSFGSGFNQLRSTDFAALVSQRILRRA